MAWREGGLHRHDLLTYQLLETIEYAVIEPFAAQLACSLEQYRAGVGPSDGNAQVGEAVTLPSQGRGYAGNWILNRTTHAEFVVARAQAGLERHAHASDELTWTQCEITLTVPRASAVVARFTNVELLQRERAGADGTDDIDFGTERHQGGGEVAAEGRKAHPAALWRDVAKIARRLETVVVGRAPPLALIVKHAACIKAQVTADGAHVALGGSSDGEGRLRHRWKASNDAAIPSQLRERDRRSER